MFFLNHKANTSRLLITAVVCFLLANSRVYAEKNSSEIDPAADNWYQVEVILFDQKAITSSESAPRELEIDFPQNWLELDNSYPINGIMSRPLFDPLSTATIQKPVNADLSQRLSDILGINDYYQSAYSDDLTPIPEASIPYQYQNTDQSTETEATLNQFHTADATEETNPSATDNVIDFKPVYEQPFQMLHSKYRDLNDTARALNRRNYKVRFHQAWRFQIDSREQSPWILVKTQPELANRQTIEGSLRFYKSRYLHFETDLWRINFSDTDSMQIVLPEIPQKPLNTLEISLLKALRFSQKLTALTSSLPHTTDYATVQLDQEFKGVRDALAGYDLQTIIPLLDSPGDTTAEKPKTEKSHNYPIKEIWPIKQSKRIQEDEVYYIDHPYMGALVTIKSYEPVAINTPPQIPRPEEIPETSPAE